MTVISSDIARLVNVEKWALEHQTPRLFVLHHVWGVVNPTLAHGPTLLLIKVNQASIKINIGLVPYPPYPHATDYPN